MTAIGSAFLGMMRSAVMTSCGKKRHARACAFIAWSSCAMGSRPFHSKYATSSKVLFSASTRIS